MYCGQCGKQLKDNMLFCPYCGTPAAAVEQEDVAALPASVENESLFDIQAEKLDFSDEKPQKAEQPSHREERVISLFEEYDAEQDDDILPQDEEAFEPLSFDFDVDEGMAVPSSEESAAGNVEADAAVDIPEEETRPSPQKRRENTVIQTPGAAKSRAKKTFIPVQDVDPENIFMDEPEEVDEYDAYDDGNDYSGGFPEEDEYEYEDREEGGFFRRHIRGLVGLLLLLMLVAICFIWASTTKGQTVLAKMNIAWDAEVYAELGYEAYQQNSNLQAARYYEKAYSHDNGNYTYAHSAMVAYYEADKLQEATSMLKICVELDPNNPDSYAEFLILYPDEETRPWEITELIRNGYQRTGDQRLNIN